MNYSNDIVKVEIYVESSVMDVYFKDSDDNVLEIEFHGEVNKEYIEKVKSHLETQYNDVKVTII